MRQTFRFSGLRGPPLCSLLPTFKIKTIRWKRNYFSHFEA